MSRTRLEYPDYHDFHIATDSRLAIYGKHRTCDTGELDPHINRVVPTPEANTKSVLALSLNLVCSPNPRIISTQQCVKEAYIVRKSIGSFITYLSDIWSGRNDRISRAGAHRKAIICRKSSVYSTVEKFSVVPGSRDGVQHSGEREIQ
ncbi:hypothetical protein RRG08_035821 [Elysia crispata]|uniref:Uncharacterized protein n=1 Tax=Elysia crispata TaxID=231223 RepID=A0AAE1DZP4_9GAST|nr:hypothetical protein RRG08_035821 [Elysia crispata]